MKGNSTADRVVAVPWVLGLYGLAGSIFLMGIYMTGAETGGMMLLAFSGVLGVLPVLSAILAYRAGDELATAILGTWGVILVGYSAAETLIVVGRLGVSAGASQALALSFFVPAAVTWTGAVAAMARSAALIVGALRRFAGRIPPCSMCLRPVG